MSYVIMVSVAAACAAFNYQVKEEKKPKTVTTCTFFDTDFIGAHDMYNFNGDPDNLPK